jgi:hypothetical protein
MGLYINSDSKGKPLPAIGKAAKLIEDGAELLFDDPKKWEEGLVCVVNNGPFEAAAYAHCESELKYFSDAYDDRPKVWLKYAHAKNLAK